MMVSKIFFIVALLLLVPAARLQAVSNDGAAQVGGEMITLSEVDQSIQGELKQVDIQIYEMRRKALGALIEERLIEREAQSRKLSKDGLLEEMKKKVLEPTEAEIRDFYEKNKTRMQGDFEKVKSQISDRLKQDSFFEARQQLITALKKKYPTQVLLKAPRVEVKNAKHVIARGPETAPVQMTVFIDFECPYCKREAGVLREVAKNYPDKVRIIHRDYPLAFHANARPAAEAARCADEQGKFWPYQKLIFKNQRELKKENLTLWAEKLGLNQEQFKNCVDSAKFQGAIDEDLTEARRLGVNGAPAAFINGRLLSGAVPFATVKEIIEEELSNG